MPSNATNPTNAPANNGVSTIAFDAMGGDKGPAEAIAGLAAALKKFKRPQKTRVEVFGLPEVLQPLLAQQGLSNNPNIALMPASQVIEMDEKPIKALKQKKDASLVRCIERVQSGQAQAALSCGNTGALMAAGTLKLRPMPGIERPALATLFPSKGHFFCVIDCGANPNANAKHLMHNAVLGSAYYADVMKCESPRVGLLSIGTEEGKGNETVLAAHQHLKQLGEAGQLNYHGLIEGFQLFQNAVDVVVCDGFVGNALLKSSESLFYLLKSYLGEELKKNPVRMLGAVLARGAFNGMRKRLSPDEYGGAPLLGLNGLVIKAHGGSSARSICGALNIAAQLARHNLTTQSKQAVEAANLSIAAAEASASNVA